jgi:hypothetical protein
MFQKVRQKNRGAYLIYPSRCDKGQTNTLFSMFSRSQHEINKMYAREKLKIVLFIPSNKNLLLDRTSSVSRLRAIESIHLLIRK